jgi:hypothetical protein
MIEEETMINAAWNENEVDMEVLVHFYFGGFVRSANGVSYTTTSSISKDTLLITLVIVAWGD